MLVTVLSALAFRLLLALHAGAVPTLLDIGKSTLLLSPITAVSFGFYGMVAGAVWSVYISLSNGRVRSSKRFFAESVSIGLLLALIFPFVDGFVQSASAGKFRLWLNPVEMLLGILLSVPCSLACAFVFRKRFIQ
jgi:hypothetical protein